MLSESLFNKCFTSANKLKGVELSELDLKLAYAVIKDDFNDDEFAELTTIVIKEVNAYGKILDVKEWIDRRDYKTKNMTEVQKTYNHFQNKKNELSLCSLLSQVSRNPADPYSLKLIKNQKFKELLDDYKDDKSPSYLFKKYNTPMLENHSSDAENKIEFKPSFLKKLGD